MAQDLTRKFAGARKADIESGDWIKVQKRVFTRWANAYLKTRKMHIDDLYTDLQDGLMLINLIEILGKEPMKFKYKKNPKMKIHKLENLKAAFEYMKAAGMTLTNIGSTDVFDGNEKIILGLIWNIIAKFQVGEISLDGVSGKEGLLLWCQRQAAGYEGVNIKDFSRSWKDGLAFCALLHKHRPDVIEFDSLSADDPAANLAQAFQLAEDYFGIERILDVEDVTSQVKPDEKIVLTYVAFFFKGFADYLRRAGLARAICKAIDITRRHDAWIEEYTTKATELQAWTAETTAQFQSRDHGNTADLVKETLVAFNQYKADVQPGYKATKGQLEGVYNTLCASARNNNRPLFQPEAGLTQEDINTSWAALEEAESKYERDVRNTYSLFRKLESAIALFNSKAAKLIEWKEAQDATFCSGEYGSSLLDAENLLAAYAIYQGQLTHFNEVFTTLEGYAASEGIDKHAQQEAVTAELEKCREALTQVVANGEAYATYLEQAREAFELNGIMDDINAWGSQQLELFNAQQYGDSLFETVSLLDDAANWSLRIEPRSQKLEAMSSEQAELMERVETEKAHLASVQEAFDIYNSWLEYTKQKFELFHVLDRVEAWMRSWDGVFAAAELGEDLSACLSLLAAYDEGYAVVQPAKQEILDNMETEHEEVVARLEASKTAMQATVEAAAAYREALDLNKEKFEQLAVLSRVNTWLTKQAGLFAAAQYGESAVDVLTLVAAYEEVFLVGLASKQAILSELEVRQEEVEAERQVVQAALDKVTGDGAEYHNQLLLSQERFEKLPTLERIETWLTAQTAVYEGTDFGDSVAAVDALLETFASSKRQLDAHKTTVSAMESEQEVITSRRAEVLAAVEATEAKAAEYEGSLNQSREYYEHLMASNKAFNSKADQFLFSCGDLEDKLNEPLMVGQYDSLKAANEVFGTSTTEAMDALTASYNELDALATELREAGVESAFGRYTLESLYATYEAVYNQMSSRQATLEEELARAEEQEKLKLAFAEVATAVVKFCEEKTHQVGNLSGTLEEQQAALQSLQAEVDSSDLVAQCQAAAEAVTEAGIVDNDKSAESIHSITAMFDALRATYQGAQQSLSASILAARDEHITPEQLKEITEVFEFFDKDGDKVLNLDEFHSCCTGLGMIITAESAEARMKELDSDGSGVINLEEFTGFMMARLVEPGHTKSDVLSAFDDLSEKQPYLSTTMLTRTFDDAQYFDYLTTNMPSVEVEGEDSACFTFGDFVEELFTR